MVESRILYTPNNRLSDSGARLFLLPLHDSYNRPHPLTPWHLNGVCWGGGAEQGQEKAAARAAKFLRLKRAGQRRDRDRAPHRMVGDTESATGGTYTGGGGSVAEHSALSGGGPLSARRMYRHVGA